MRQLRQLKRTTVIWMRTRKCRLYGSLIDEVRFFSLDSVPIHLYVDSVRGNWTVNQLDSEQTTERFGQVLVEEARRFGYPVWTTAHDLALSSPRHYRDRLHPDDNLNQQVMYCTGNTKCE